MKINLEFAEVAVPLFLNGKNFGNKLTADNKTGIVLVYDQSEKELWITFNFKSAIIPMSNVVSMTPDSRQVTLDESKLAPAPQMQIGKTGKFNSNLSTKAQVSSPTSHVFEQPPKGAA